MRAISGFVTLDSGEISLFGETLERAAGSAAAGRRRLGVVPQDIALYPLLTACENLSAFAALHGVESRLRKERVAWALEWTGLAERADEPSKRFSGGMKRRLNIACGILHRPDVVLLDEPTVGVDPQSRQRIWEMLEELRGRGASLLLTTHQLDEAQRVCDRIVIIDHGRAIAGGTLEELVAQTIGSQRRVAVCLDGAGGALPANAGFTVEDGVIHSDLEDLGTELPVLVQRIAAAGGRISDVRIESPSLQSVFIHLTGRELRE